MKQIPFNLDIEEEYNSEDFIVSCCNIEPYQLIHKHSLWPFKRLLIVGEEGSGKTHLCNIWKDIIGAVSLREGETSSVEGLIFDDIDSIKNEEYLFHLINSCQNHSQYLLMTAQAMPKYELADLRSRINATQKILIKQPDDVLLRVILGKYLIDRQLNVPNEVCEYILSRAERSFSFIKSFIEQVDYLSLKDKRNITIPLVKRVLEERMFVRNENEQS